MRARVEDSHSCLPSARSKPDHQAGFERMRQQLVTGIDANTVLQFAAQLRREHERKQIFAAFGLHAFPLEIIACRLAQFRTLGGPPHDQLDLDVARCKAVQGNRYP